MHHRTKLLNSVLMGSVHGAHRGIRADSVGCRIHRSRVLNIFSGNFHTQALAGWEGCSDLIAEDSEFQASGENVIFGGAHCNDEKLTPQDITFINCDLSKPKEWLDNPAITCVNNFELKRGKRVKLYGCKMDGSVAGGGQDGYAIVLTVRQEPAPWGSIEDVEIIGCEIRNTMGGVHFLGWDDMAPPPPDNIYSYGHLKNILLTRNRFRDMGEGARQFFINSGSENLQFISNEVYAREGIKTNSFMTFANKVYPSRGLVYKDNNVPEGNYGIVGDGVHGPECLDIYAPGWTFSGNTIREQSGYYNYPDGVDPR
jgi:hypothetical protein